MRMFERAAALLVVAALMAVAAHGGEYLHERTRALMRWLIWHALDVMQLAPVSSSFATER